jgi:MoxR-like ATPase
MAQPPSEGWTRREMFRAWGSGLVGLSLINTCSAGEPPAVPKEEPDPDFLAMLNRYRNPHSRIHAEMEKMLVGQRQVVDEVVMALFCNSHVLLSGPPGVAKGLTVSTLSRVLGLSCMRIRHTDDLLPEDVTGSEVLDEGNRSGPSKKTHLGPIFANVVLADDFNCAPPTTQAVLFEAMQERQVQVGSRRLPLERPFLVLVMENPLEGRYPLDASHKARFMFNACFSTLCDADHLAALKRYTTWQCPSPIDTVLSKEDIQQIQSLVRRLPIPRSVVDYAVNLVRSTRPRHSTAPAFVRNSVAWGIGPRGAQFLVLGAKAHALLHGQSQASIEGIRAVAPGVLRHRIELTARAKAQGTDGNQIITRLLTLEKPCVNEGV